MGHSLTHPVVRLCSINFDKTMKILSLLRTLDEADENSWMRHQWRNAPLLDSSNYCFDNFVRFCLSSVRLGRWRKEGGWFRIPEIEFTGENPYRTPRFAWANVKIGRSPRTLCVYMREYVFLSIYILYIYAAMCYREYVVHHGWRKPRDNVLHRCVPPQSHLARGTSK